MAQTGISLSVPIKRDKLISYILYIIMCPPLELPIA